ncbi:MAG: ABC transporter permease [Myxococcota bacterium]
MKTIMLEIAWRNLWRNRTRTIIVGSAIIFSYAMMLIFFGIGDDSHGKMEEAAARAAGGEVLIHGDGFWKTQSSDIVMDRAAEVRERVESVDGVRHVVPRVLINGLMTSPTGNEPVQIRGIDTRREFDVEDYSEDLVEGAFFSGDFDHPIVIGTNLRDKLDVDLGDKLVLTATTPEGEVTRALFRLDGVIEAPASSQGGLAFTTIEAAQDALKMGDRIVQMGVFTTSNVSNSEADERLEKALSTFDVEVLTWQEAVPEMVGLIRLDDSFSWLFIVVIFVVVTFSIANTFLMAVMERVREFGLLNAIGVTPGRIGALIIWETVILAATSIVIGFGIGLGVHLWVQRVGIDMAAFGMDQMDAAGIDMSDLIIYSHLDPMKWGLGTLVVFFIIVLSAAYPAWRASNMAPSEAMRFYE